MGSPELALVTHKWFRIKPLSLFSPCFSTSLWFICVLSGPAAASRTSSQYRICRGTFLFIYVGHSVESSVLLHHRTSKLTSASHAVAALFRSSTFPNRKSVLPNVRWIVGCLSCVQCWKKRMNRGSQRAGTFYVLWPSRPAASIWVWTQVHYHKPSGAPSISMVSMSHVFYFSVWTLQEWNWWIVSQV